MTNKHNKKRNTGFIYEALVREVVKQSLEEGANKRDVAVSLLKKHFNKKSLLYKDLIFYKTLAETKNTTEKLASKILKETLTMRNKLNKEELFKEQSHVISQINKNISKSVFSNFVPSYKFLASIGQLFNDDLKPKTKVLLEEQIVDNMISSDSSEKTEEIKINNSVINTFVKRFNNTYGDKLLAEQKTLINKFIKSFRDDGLEFKIYLDREINRLLEQLKKNYNDQELAGDSSMKEKYGKIIEFLENTAQVPLNEKLVLKVTQVQQLIKEINTDD
jgi:hypothetical protein